MITETTELVAENTCISLPNICFNYAKWNKSKKKVNTVWCHFYAESKIYSKLVNKTKTQTHRYREQTSGYQREGGGERQDVGGGKGVFIGSWEIMCMKFENYKAL